MLMDEIDRGSQLIIGKSWWTGKWVSDFGVVAQNLRSRRVDQGLNEEIRCRVLDSRRGRQSSCDLMQQRVWTREPRNKIERTTDPIR
jgi:hypothetical protein